MINRDNWKLAKRYLDYRQTILQNDPKTIRSGWIALKHLLQWADHVPFKDVAKIRPTLPDYLLRARNDGKPDPLSPAHMSKVLTWARNVFLWLRIEHPSTYRTVPPTWIQSLQVRRSHNMKSRLVIHEFWTLDEIKQVIDLPLSTLRVKRDKAALCFIFLSAMRGSAFVTMPIRSVDLTHNRIYQLPEWGVQTKNSKAAITYLLPIPDLMKEVREWDVFVRSKAKNENTSWYTKLTRDGLDIDGTDTVDEILLPGRRVALYQGLRELCDLAGVVWKSPHKIRHGHGVYGLKRAKTMAQYKAHSQNMMHENIATTEKYSELIDNEVGQIISTFTEE